MALQIYVDADACPVKEEMEGAAKELVSALPGVQSATSNRQCTRAALSHAALAGDDGFDVSNA